MLVVLGVPQQDDPGMHPRLDGLSHGRNSPWAVIVGYVVLVDYVRRLDLTRRRGDCERARLGPKVICSGTYRLEESMMCGGGDL